MRELGRREPQPERGNGRQEGGADHEEGNTGSLRGLRAAHRLRDPSTPASMTRHMDWVLLVASLLVILVAAELFTNGVEWVGEGFGLSEGAVGSVLAAIGTALPETLLPIVAIVSGHEAGDEIGIGAILGAPFMLTTLAMVVIGTAVLFYARGGRRSVDLDIDRRVIQQDLGYFLVMYALAMIAGLLHVRVFDVCRAIVLVVGYGSYVRRHFQAPEAEAGAEDGEGGASDIRPLRLWVALRWAFR